MGDVTKPYRDKFIRIFQLHRNTLGHKALQVVITFILIDFSWIFFRADSMKQAFEIIRSMCKIRNPWILFDGALYNCGINSANFRLIIICSCILLFADYCKHKHIELRKVILKQDYWVRWIFISCAVCSILTFGIWGANYDASAFIYFQF